MDNSKEKYSDHIERAYASSAKADHYAKWAPDYDTDMGVSGYAAPAQAVELFIKLVPADARVIEFGCGTGLVGELLAQQKYTQLVGLDNCPSMLEKASGKKSYQSLREHDLTQPLMDDIRYDAGICVGVCAFGPVMAEHIVHMTSVLAENAPLILTINGRAWDEHVWAEQLEESQLRDRFCIEYINTIPYLNNEGIDGKLLVIRNTEIENETNVPEQ